MYNVQFDLTGQRIQNSYQQLLQNDTASGLFYNGVGEQVVVSSTNAVTASYAITASYALNGGGTVISSSYAVSASYALSSSYATTASYALNSPPSISSSYSAYAVTASYALNGGGGGGGSTNIPYVTIYPDASSYITCSFTDVKEYTTFTTNSVYNFTASNLPSAGNYSLLSLLIYNIAASSSSLSFPENWTWFGLIPVYLPVNKSAYINLEAYGNNIYAGWALQY